MRLSQASIWQELWKNETENKLYEILPNLKESLSNATKTRICHDETPNRPHIDTGNAQLPALEGKTNGIAMFATYQKWLSS